MVFFCRLERGKGKEEQGEEKKREGRDAISGLIDSAWTCADSSGQFVYSVMRYDATLF